MSLQHRSAEQAVHPGPRRLFCREGSQPMRASQKTHQSSVQDAMLAAVPVLRAFAMSLCGKLDRAEDLVQETLVRAMANIQSFTPGTNMSAWLCTILRNQFHSEYRKRRREVEDPDGGYLYSLKSAPEQHSRWNSRNSSPRWQSSRSNSARLCCWSARRAFPTMTQLRYVRPRWGR